MFYKLFLLQANYDGEKWAIAASLKIMALGPMGSKWALRAPRTTGLGDYL